MKVLLSWLRDFVDVPGTAEEVAAVMSVRGFAVEGIDDAPGGDRVIDFEVTGNRPDCMSVVGMAREVATAYQLPLKDVPDAFAALTPGRHPELTVAIDEPSLCPRYVGAVADVTVGPSPDWLQTRLLAAGIRPISNIVDITNYVLVERGHPMHAFDQTRIAGGQIRVRRARPGERLRTLDDQTRTLTADMLVIADAGQATAIAGVMGGGDSEVGTATRTIVLESACFDPLSVRRTSRALGLKTEASIRFERGADASQPDQAMARACALLEATGAGRVRGPIVDAYPGRRGPRTLPLRRGQIARILGTSIPDDDVVRLLTALDFTLTPTSEGWLVTAPTRRVDVVREVDLIEELARHHGLDQLPMTFPPLLAAPPPSDPRLATVRRLRAVMTAAGFFEAVTFGFVSETAAASYASADEVVAIANPLSESFAVLRPTALAGLVDAVAHNRRREQRDVRLFEIGARFTRHEGERRALSCVWGGAGELEHWSGAGRPVDFFDVKAVMLRACDALGVTAGTDPHREPWLVPGRAAAFVSNGTRIGVLGQLAPEVADRHGLPPSEPVFVAELDLDAAAPFGRGRDVLVEPLPRYPSVTRDISVLLDDTVAAADVRAAVRAAAPSTLVRVREFDRYQGKGVPDGKVSLSLRLTFRSPDRTLTDGDVQAAMDGVLASLRDRFGAAQR